MKKIHEHFDKVYVINIERAVERKILTQNNLGIDLDVQYEIFKAVDGNDLLTYPQKSENSKMEGWTKGAYALKLTTINLLKEAKEKGYKSVLVCEDDLYFNFNAIEKTDYGMTHVPKDWELIHFASNHIIPAEWLQGRVYRIKKAWSCQMYAINSSIFDLYIELLENNDFPIDYITSEFIHSRGKSYSIEPSIVVTRPNYSYIRNKDVNYQ